MSEDATTEGAPPEPVDEALMMLRLVVHLSGLVITALNAPIEATPSDEEVAHTKSWEALIELLSVAGADELRAAIRRVLTIGPDGAVTVVLPGLLRATGVERG